MEKYILVQFKRIAVNSLTSVKSRLQRQFAVAEEPIPSYLEDWYSPRPRHQFRSLSVA